MHRKYGWWAGWPSVTLAVLTAFALGGQAEAGVSYTTVYKDHLVYGATPRALWQYMTSHPINDPDDGPALANITHQHKLTITTRSSGGACAVSDINFTWHFVITLPKAVDGAKMSSATVGMWQQFLAKARWHELHRRAIFLSCGASFLPAAKRLTAPTCWGLESKVRSYIDKQYAVCMAKQRAFGIADRASVARLSFIRAAR